MGAGGSSARSAREQKEREEMREAAMESFTAAKVSTPSSSRPTTADRRTPEAERPKIDWDATEEPPATLTAEQKAAKRIRKEKLTGVTKMSWTRKKITELEPLKDQPKEEEGISVVDAIKKFDDQEKVFEDLITEEQNKEEQERLEAEEAARKAAEAAAAAAAAAEAEAAAVEAARLAALRAAEGAERLQARLSVLAPSISPSDSYMTGELHGLPSHTTLLLSATSPLE